MVGKSADTGARPAIGMCQRLRGELLNNLGALSGWKRVLLRCFVAALPCGLISWGVVIILLFTLLCGGVHYWFRPIDPFPMVRPFVTLFNMVEAFRNRAPEDWSRYRIDSRSANRFSISRALDDCAKSISRESAVIGNSGFCARSNVNAWTAAQILVALGQKACAEYPVLIKIINETQGDGGWREFKDDAVESVLATAWSLSALYQCEGYSPSADKAVKWLLGVAVVTSGGALDGWSVAVGPSIKPEVATYATVSVLGVLGSIRGGGEDVQSRIDRYVADGAERIVSDLEQADGSLEFYPGDRFSSGTSAGLSALSLAVVIQLPAWKEVLDAKTRRRVVERFIKTLPGDLSVEPWRFESAVKTYVNERGELAYFDHARLYRQHWTTAASILAYCSASMRGRFRILDYLSAHERRSGGGARLLAQSVRQVPWIAAEYLVAGRWAAERSFCDESLVGEDDESGL